MVLNRLIRNFVRGFLHSKKQPDLHVQWFRYPMLGEFSATTVSEMDGKKNKYQPPLGKEKTAVKHTKLLIISMRVSGS